MMILMMILTLGNLQDLDVQRDAIVVAYTEAASTKSYTLTLEWADDREKKVTLIVDKRIFARTKIGDVWTYDPEKGWFPKQ